MKRFVLLFSLFIPLLFIDIGTKYLVYQYNSLLPFFVWKNFLGIDFCIQYTTNLGGPWGIWSSISSYLLLFRTIIASLLALSFFTHPLPILKDFSRTMILTGALANILDFFFYGSVIDMCNFLFLGQSYGIFNLADVMIFLGTISFLFCGRKKKSIIIPPTQSFFTRCTRK